MSFRPHGYASIDSRMPRALGVCDRCGKLVNHDTMQDQLRYRGPRLQSLGILVCSNGCLDIPNEQERTIILPMDPVPINFARPENYVNADNPASPLGYDPANSFLPVLQLGENIGNMTMGAGVNAAFNGQVNISSSLGTTISRGFSNCANLANSVSSFQNWVGKNWAADATGTLATMPSTVPAQTHVVSDFSLVSPGDQPFLRTGATGYQLEASTDGVTWTTLYSGTTVGTAGEIVTVNSTFLTAYQYHRATIQGDGISQVGIAQLILNISDAGPNDI